jgi:GTP-binding protein HflX
MLRKRIQEADNSKDLHRKSREELLQTALVGYTNAGKSTLLNALTHSDVLVEDALFATLDASVRLLNPKARPAILAIDTVGFIDRLPHNLVASFRSTLSAVLEADLLMHVLDASHPEVQRHYQVTMDVLKELGADHIPMLLVFNKIDRCKDQQLLKIWAAGLARESKHEGVPAPIFISALDPKMVDGLRAQVLGYFERGMEILEVVVPYEDGKTLAQINQVGRIEKQKPLETGTFVRFKTTTMFANKYNFGRYRA